MFLDYGFYPRLLDYQMSVPVSRFIRQHQIPPDHFYLYKMEEERSLEFYSNHAFVHTNHPEQLGQGDWMLTSAEGLDSLDRNNFQVIYSGESFHVSTLSLSFLNPETRKQETRAFYILRRI
jgi:hypothetical protein